MEPGKLVTLLLTNHHDLNSPVYSLRKGVIWLLVTVIAELTPTVSRFILCVFFFHHHFPIGVHSLKFKRYFVFHYCKFYIIFD